MIVGLLAAKRSVFTYSSTEGVRFLADAQILDGCVQKEKIVVGILEQIAQEATYRTLMM